MGQRYWQRVSWREERDFHAVVEGVPWIPKKGMWPYRILCLFGGCREDVLFEDVQRFTYDRNEEPPEPKPGVVYIEQKVDPLPGDVMQRRLLRCSRCAAEWYDRTPIRDEAPIKYSQWLEIPVKGRVVGPAKPVPEGNVTLWDALKKDQ